MAKPESSSDITPPEHEPSGRILLLAAGQSRRFGSYKLLHPLADGRPLILHSLQLALQLNLPVTVAIDRNNVALEKVLRVAVQDHKNGLNAALDILPLAEAEAGLGANLARVVTLNSQASGWLVVLADMPFVQPATIQSVLAHADSSNIVMPVFQAQRGHPVWFGSEFFDDLVQLRGDQGGRGILQKYPECVLEVAVADPAIHFDIDTPADLERLQALNF